MPTFNDKFLKFSDISKMLCQEFGNLSIVAVSRIIKDAFPLSQNVRSTANDHSTLIFGVTLASQFHYEQLLDEIKAIKSENVALKSQIQSDSLRFHHEMTTILISNHSSPLVQIL